MMIELMPSRCKTFAVVLCLAPLCVMLHVNRSNAQKEADASSSGVINLVLHNAITKATTPLPVKSVRLRKVRVTVPAGRVVPTIQKLLLEQYVHPNMDAVSLVYEWNPDVTSLRMLKPKQELWLPSVESLDKSVVFSKDLRVEIELDTALKEQLKQTTAILTGIARSEMAPAVVAFQTAGLESATWRDFKSTVDQLSKITAVVAEKTRPISHRMLEHVIAQAYLLLRLATSNDLDDLKGPITEAQRIKYIEKDLTIQASTLIDIKSAGAISDSNNKVTVTVNVFKRADFTTPLAGYRVYYVGAYELGISQPQSFGPLRPPITGNIEPGYYTFWATKEGLPPATPDTSFWTNTVDNSLTRTIDLQLK